MAARRQQGQEALRQRQEAERAAKQLQQQELLHQQHLQEQQRRSAALAQQQQTGRSQASGGTDLSADSRQTVQLDPQQQALLDARTENQRLREKTELMESQMLELQQNQRNLLSNQQLQAQQFQSALQPPVQQPSGGQHSFGPARTPLAAGPNAFAQGANQYQLPQEQKQT